MQNCSTDETILPQGCEYHLWLKISTVYLQPRLPFLDPTGHLYIHHGHFKDNKPKVNFLISSIKPGFSTLVYVISIHLLKPSNEGLASDASNQSLLHHHCHHPCWTKVRRKLSGFSHSHGNPLTVSQKTVQRPCLLTKMWCETTYLYISYKLQFLEREQNLAHVESFNVPCSLEYNPVAWGKSSPFSVSPFCPKEGVRLVVLQQDPVTPGSFHLTSYSVRHRYKRKAPQDT